MTLLCRLRQKLHMDDPAQRRREINWLWNLMCRQYKAIARIALLSLAGTVLGLGGNIASKYLIDSITALDLSGVYRFAAMFLLMVPGSIILNGLSAHTGAKLRIRSKNNLQKVMFNRILNARWESLEPYRNGELLNLLNMDVGAVSEASITFLPSLLSTVLRFVGTAVIMLYFDPWMAMIALAGIPVMILLSGCFTQKMRSYDLIMKELNGEVMSFQTDSFRNLTSIKAFALTDYFSEELDKLQQSYEHTYLDANTFHLGMNAGISLAGMAVTGAGMCYGVYQLWLGNISYGSLIMLLQLAGSLRSSFSALLSQGRRAISIGNSLGRLMALEALPEEDLKIPEGLSGRKVTILLDQVSFSYQNGSELLHSFDFRADPGDVIAVTGPSGEGKTTLLRLLLGLVGSQTGSATILDGDGNVYPLCAGTRRLFSYVPQGNSMIAGTIGENLRLLCPEATDDELWNALRICCVDEFVRQLPEQLNHSVGVGGQGLSEGQAQRIAIARSLLRRAPVLLLDEATSALDEATERSLLDNLRQDTTMRTCILVTHRQTGLEYCNRVYEIAQGHVTEVTDGV